ncbi:carbohydrate kinase family protein [Pararhodobacter sp.]|uniref:carbohydrate kinase family protein n=1 Tax=Pararhodobacter sp. TaxID=2127056 RepID=UPI002FE0801F
MILCCGEALIDMLPVQDGTAFAPHTGGAVFNTAIALGRLGAPTSFFSGLSADFFGDMLRARLADAGVDASPCVTAARPCTLAFVRLVAGQATYAFYDENTAGRLLTEADLPSVTAKACFFGGISLVAEPCGGAYEAMMGRARAAGAVTMIDPNIRPGFIQDEAAYRARLGRMLGMADIVKLSVEDMGWLARGDGEGFVQGLLAGGTALVLVTDGGKGATAVSARHRVVEPARRVAVVDTVGAGDTFNAGVLASLSTAGLLSRAGLAALDESAIRAALRLGSAAAAVTVSRAGANPPWAGEIQP